MCSLSPGISIVKVLPTFQPVIRSFARVFLWFTEYCPKRQGSLKIPSLVFWVEWPPFSVSHNILIANYSLSRLVSEARNRKAEPLTQVSGITIPTPTDSSHPHVGFAPWHKGLWFPLIFNPAAFGNIHLKLSVNGFMWITHWLVPTWHELDCVFFSVAFWDERGQFGS